MKQEKIRAFFENYMKDYNRYAQEEATITKAEKYWDPKIRARAFIKMSDGTYPIVCNGLDEWKVYLINSHKDITEETTIKEMVIDTKDLKAALVLDIKKFDRKTGELKQVFDGLGLYRLSKQKDKLKIRELDFYCGDSGGFTHLHEL